MEGNMKVTEQTSLHLNMHPSFIVVPRPHPLKTSGLVNQVKFPRLVHAFVTSVTNILHHTHFKKAQTPK